MRMNKQPTFIVNCKAESSSGLSLKADRRMFVKERKKKEQMPIFKVWKDSFTNRSNHSHF